MGISFYYSINDNTFLSGLFSEFAQQDGRPCAGQVHHRVLPHQGVVRLELDGQVVVQTTGQGAVGTAIALDEDFHGLADLRLDEVHRDLVLNLEQAAHPVGLLLARRRVGHVCRFGAGALGIDEGEQLHVADLLDEVERLLEILLRLTRETDDDIAREGDAGNRLARVLDEFHVMLDGVMAVHQLEQTVGAALHRQMQMLADLRLRRDGVDQLEAGILRVARHEADVVIARHSAEQVEQVGKVHLFFQTLTVAVDVLTQERNFFVASLDQTPELGEDIAGLAALFTAADIRHDAIGAEVVAAVHDGQPCPELALPADGDVLDDDRTLRRLHQDALVLLQLLGDELGQGVDAVHAKDEVNIGVALAQLFDDMLLVRHAAAQTDHQAGLFLLQALERADVAEDALLGVFTHGAGVEEDQVGIFGLIAEAVADIDEDALDALAIVDVLLAAVAVDESQRRRVVRLTHQLGGGAVVFKCNVFQ